MRRVVWGLPLALMLFPGTAAAEPTAEDRFDPKRVVQLLGAQGLDIDTGWQPPASAIQVMFLVHAQDDVIAYMPGDAIYDWGSQELVFVGDEGEGRFEIDVGTILEAKVKFDLAGNQFESDLIGPYELGVFDLVYFTPYLLEGNADRPALIETVTPKTEVIAYPLVDAVIASGELVVDAAFDVSVSLACERIDVEAEHGPQAVVDVELGAVELAGPPEGDPLHPWLHATATLRCNTVADVTLLLYPGVQVTIGFDEYELAPFELPVPILTGQQDPFDFEPMDLLFEAPPLGGGTSGGDSGSSSGADSQGQSGSASGTGDEPGSTGEPEPETDGGDTDGTSGGAAVEGDGCACRVTRDPRTGLAWGLLGLLALVGRRRRHQALRA